MAMKPLVISGKDQAAIARDLGRMKALLGELTNEHERLLKHIKSNLADLRCRVEALELQRKKRTPARATRRARKRG